MTRPRGPTAIQPADDGAQDFMRDVVVASR
jgi:hypothetical protein